MATRGHVESRRSARDALGLEADSRSFFQSADSALAGGRALDRHLAVDEDFATIEVRTYDNGYVKVAGNPLACRTTAVGWSHNPRIAGSAATRVGGA
jgi:hypothetical protein